MSSMMRSSHCGQGKYDPQKTAIIFKHRIELFIFKCLLIT